MSTNPLPKELIYQLRVTLMNGEPPMLPIWRCIQVREVATANYRATRNQLRVTLMNGEPPMLPIWRCIQVRGDTTLTQLHRILQVAMGWEDTHSYQFVIDGAPYGINGVNGKPGYPNPE